MAKLNQHEKILLVYMRGDYMSNRDAMVELGIGNFKARNSELERMGYVIQREWVYKNQKKSHYRYWMNPEDRVLKDQHKDIYRKIGA